MADGVEPDPELLRRLEERVDRATETAERLLRAAAANPITRASEGDDSDDRLVVEDAGAPGPADQGPPPSGWQRPGQGAPDQRWATSEDLELLLAVLAAVRDRIPADLQQRLMEAVRELLIALRALIDWYLERLERRAPGPAEVQDIPIL